MAGTIQSNPNGGYRNGTPIILPHNFGNVTAGSNQPFGNPIPQPNPSLDGGNPIITPHNFGNEVSFVLQCEPSHVVIAPNSTGTSTVTLTDLLGTNTGTLGYNGAPSGMTVAFSPATVDQAASSTATITVGSSVPPGRYDLGINATQAGANIEIVRLTVLVAAGH
jgi:hypothetical protein